jgi:hypothetical protein
MDQKKTNTKKKKEPKFWENEPPIWACTNKKERANFADELYESDYDKEWN